MTTPNRFERQAADRLLTKAVEEAVKAIRAGESPRVLLNVAGVSAALLLGEAQDELAAARKRKAARPRAVASK